MSALDTSPESVAAMIAELRKRKIVHRQNNDDGEPYSTHSYDAGPVNKDGPDAADLLAALSAERDETRRMLDAWKIAAEQKLSDLADATRATIAELQAERQADVQPFGHETGEPWKTKPTAQSLAEAIADMAINDRMGLIQRVRDIIVRDRAYVAQSRDATIARLTREKAEAVEAEREACAEIADGMTEWDTPRLKRIGEIIRARASKGTET